MCVCDYKVCNQTPVQYLAKSLAVEPFPTTINIPNEFLYLGCLLYGITS